MKNRNKAWTTKELEILHRYYPISPQTAMGMMMIEFPEWDRSMTALRAKAKVLGLSKLHDVKGHFTKGHIPANKGKKMKVTENMKKNFYRKGHVPANHKPVGSIVTRQRRNRFTSSGEKVKYQWIKIAEPNKWELLHRHLWKKHYGDYPKGKIIVFKDSDPLNCTIDNLEAITKKENVIRNQNREKFKETCKEPTDRQLAGWLSHNRPDLKAQLLTQPELLDLHRKKYQLNRKIKITES